MLYTFNTFTFFYALIRIKRKSFLKILKSETAILDLRVTFGSVKVISALGELTELSLLS